MKVSQGILCALCLWMTTRMTICTAIKCPTPLILVSMDGFRSDYFDKHSPPNLMAIKDNGVRVMQIENTFTTKTFPNHWTMVTGLYEESHGIVANHFYDPVLNETFHLGLCGDFWNASDPIWTTLEENGIKTGTYFWPGSECEHHGVMPTFWMKYNQSVPFSERVDTVLQWLNLPCAHRPSFISLYFHEPDEAGHKFGPNSKEVKEAVLRVDSAIGRLVQGLEDAGTLDETNLIITADHGMAQISLDKVVFMEDYLNISESIAFADYGPVSNILPKPGKEDAVFKALYGAHPNMTVYMKEDIPERFHYKNNIRIMPIVAIADLGWSVYNYRSNTAKGFDSGNHGYDNTSPEMHPIFLAQGPAFRKHFTLERMKNVDLYPMMARILGIQPNPNNGSETSRQLLSQRKASFLWIDILILVVIFMMATGLLHYQIKNIKRPPVNKDLTGRFMEGGADQNL